MKTFDDLIFRPHRMAESWPEDLADSFGFKDTIHAIMKFDNGETISVVGGGPLYGDGVSTFEVMDCECEVHGYVTKDGVTEIMVKTEEKVTNVHNRTIKINHIDEHRMI